MEEENKVEKLLIHLKDYAETQFQLSILSVQNNFVNLLSSMASIVVLGVLLLFILLFTGIGTAIWLGEYFHNYFLGFFYIAGFYILILFIIYFNREKWIKSPLINALLKKINLDDEN